MLEWEIFIIIYHVYARIVIHENKIWQNFPKQNSFSMKYSLYYMVLCEINNIHLRLY